MIKLIKNKKSSEMAKGCSVDDYCGVDLVSGAGCLTHDYCGKDQSACPKSDDCDADYDEHCSIQDYCAYDYAGCATTDGCYEDTTYIFN